MRARRSAWRRCGLALLAAATVCGCSLRWLPGVPRVPTVADCPGPLVSTDEMPGSFVLRQDIRVRSGEIDVGARLVVEKQGRRLVVVGFSTLGFEAFNVVQEGRETTVDAPLGPAWGLPPLNVLRDLHRVRFLVVPGGPFTDGEVVGTRAGLRVTERWQNGRAVARTLARPGNDPSQDVRIVFTDDAATITHAGCGYETTIVTTDDASSD